MCQHNVSSIVFSGMWKSLDVFFSFLLSNYIQKYVDKASRVEKQLFPPKCPVCRRNKAVDGTAFDVCCLCNLVLISELFLSQTQIPQLYYKRTTI